MLKIRLLCQPKTELPNVVFRLRDDSFELLPLHEYLHLNPISLHVIEVQIASKLFSQLLKVINHDTHEQIPNQYIPYDQCCKEVKHH